MFEALTRAIGNSQFLQTLQSIRIDCSVDLGLSGDRVRPLGTDEIKQLIADGNTAEDWQLMRVARGFKPGRVKRNEFRGQIILGRFDGTTRTPWNEEVPSGLVCSSFSNCVIGQDSLIRNVGLLEKYVVGERAFVSDCGRVHCNGSTVFGNGTKIPIGPQSGGRWLESFAEITLEIAEFLTSNRAEPGFEGQFASFLNEYLERVRSVRGMIGTGAALVHIPALQNVYIGPGTVIDAAVRIENATILSSLDEPTRIQDGVCISDSIIQWGSRLRGPAAVERSVLLEYSQVERFGKVMDSVIAPNSSVGSAEVTSCLVGPFVGCNHQGLLISARWPGGRGNLGYGAAIGCNHTSRAPDQEAVLGEGLFIGLEARIQYPVDLSRSPYTVLASGVSLTPQKIAFPFSLIRPAGESLPGNNLLIPAWVLNENLYSIQRNMTKFRSRDRAKRHRFNHDAFRPEIMDLVKDALRRLEQPIKRDIYTEREIPGLGRNLLLEKDRVAAIRSYTDHLERLHLMGKLEQAGHFLLNRSTLSLTDSQQWRDLGRLENLLEAYGWGVEFSKARDEERGARLIEDYGRVHEPTREDPIVRQTWEEIRRIQKQLGEVLTSLAQHQCEVSQSGRDIARSGLVIAG